MDDAELVLNAVTIRPADAQFDIDVLTLDSFLLSEDKFLPQPENRDPILGRIISIVLTDGIWARKEPNGQVKVQEIPKAECHSFLGGITDEGATLLTDMLAHWQGDNVPLRLLAFETHIVLMEDNGNNITVPRGPTEILANQRHNN